MIKYEDERKYAYVLSKELREHTLEDEIEKTGYNHRKRLENCGIGPGSPQMGPRGVEPSTGDETNPLFLGARPDSIRTGERRWLASIVLQGKSQQFMYCVDCQLTLAWNNNTGKNAGYADFTGHIHDPNDPVRPCRIIPLPAKQLDDGDGKVHEMLERLSNLRQKLTEMASAIEEKKKLEERGPRHLNITENYR